MPSLPAWKFAATPETDFQAKLNAFLEYAKEQIKGGVSFATISAIVGQFIQVAVDAARDLADDSSEEKKANVMQAVTFAFDTLVSFVVLPWYLQPVWWALAPLVRGWIIDWIDGQVEATYSDQKDRAAQAASIVTPAEQTAILTAGARQ